jgi:CubicO group peptidase (beta-lactamase class C family)
VFPLADIIPVIRTLGILLLLIPGRLAPQAAAHSEMVGWRGVAADAGLDPARLAEMTASVRRGEHGNVHAILIEKDGRLVYEEYFTGRDWSLDRDLGEVTFHRGSLHDIRSASKSVVATLVGIAIHEGAIPSVDAPLHALLPDYAHLLTGGKREIRLRDVLAMSAGLAFDEWSLPYRDPDNDWIRLVRSPDPLAFVLGRALVDPPGASFTYNTGLTQLLAAVLERATGEAIQDYARRVLFRPLGIHDVVWLGDIGGIPYAGVGLRMRARDLARLGSLYPNRGMWNGAQVVPAQWVEEATRRRLDVSYPGPTPDFVAGVAYGYQWWIVTYRTPAGELRVPTMWGNGEQRVMVVPELGLVLTVLAGEYGQVTGMPDRLLVEYVVSALAPRPR